MDKIRREKFQIQDKQYNFPYHYLAHFDEKGFAARHKLLSWSMEYLCYLKHVVELVKEVNPESILEVGCGDGRLTGVLNESYEHVLGVDISEKAIRLAQAIHHPELFKAIDASELNDQYEVVISMEVLEHIPDEGVDDFIRILADKAVHNGTVIITAPTIVDPVQPKHYRHYDIELFKRQLKSSGAPLEILNFEYIYKKNSLMKWYQKFTNNRFFFLEFHPFRRYLWKKTWNKWRYATPDKGRHLVVQLQKK